MTTHEERAEVYDQQAARLEAMAAEIRQFDIGPVGPVREQYTTVLWNLTGLAAAWRECADMERWKSGRANRAIRHELAD